MTSLRDFALVSFVIFSVFSLSNIAHAQTQIAVLSSGTVEGTGTHFSIPGSNYLNITLDSTESIKLKMESVPEMVTMMIESSASSSATSTQITLFGLATSTTYYKYEDDYHNLTTFTTDESGNYFYTQDLSKPHLIFIQPRHSTKFIKDNATGGDCALIGIWNSAAKTCTMNVDLTETIQIDSDGITLDGNGHTLTGFNTGSGVYLYGRTSVTVKNLNVKNFSLGILLFSSSGNIFFGDTALNNNAGIILDSSGGNTLANNTVFNNGYDGIVLDSSNNNTLIGNTVLNNSSFAAGISLYSSNGNTVTGNTASNNYFGIYLDSSGSNTLTKNTVLNNSYGLILFPSGGNRIYNNNFINNNLMQAYVDTGINTWNLVSPIGGNYWSNYDTPQEGCSDANNDNFCDSSYLFDGGQDNLPWTTQDGWKTPTNQPPTISSLLQLKSDGVTAITESGITTESTLVFKTTLSDADNDQVKLQVELKQASQPFDGTALFESGFVASGESTTIFKDIIPEGQYHWRARAVDDKGNMSAWQEFGTTGNVDFSVVSLGQAAAELTKLVINGPYLGDGDTYGGKGWDSIQAEYVASNVILSGYQYWNNKLRTIAFGAGLDCSGLTQWAYNYSFDPKKSLTRNVIRYDGADGQYKNNTETLVESDLKPGDLLFLDQGNDNFMDHVAMYVGDNGDYDIMEAYSPLEGIRPANKTEFKSRIGFNKNKHIRRVVLSPSIGGQVKAGSPVDLAVIDPDGFTITPTTAIQTSEEYLREVPGELYYSENELGPDGRPEDVVYWPTQKIGNYVVKAIPEAGVSSTSTYNLEFWSGNITISLAQNVPLSQAPSQGYGITTSATGTITTFIPVIIDIKPDSYLNSINLGSKGIVPMAIFSSNTFDVHQINLNSVILAGAPIKIKKNGQLMASYEDVNGDGFTDVVVHIVTEAFQLTSLNVKAELNGFLFDGTVIKGSDSVRIVP